MSYQRSKRITLPIESDHGVSLTGFLDTHDVRIDFGEGRTMTTDFFYVAFQGAAERGVTERAITIRSGKVVQGVQRLQSSLMLISETPHEIVKRVKRRETVVVSRANLDKLTVALTVTITENDDEAFEKTLDDETCTEIDQRLMQMQRLLASYESPAERTQRLEEERAEAQQRAAEEALCQEQAPAAAE